MSKTPRTKSEAIKYLAGMGHVACDRIEELETELAEARAEIERLKKLQQFATAINCAMIEADCNPEYLRGHECVAKHKLLSLYDLWRKRVKPRLPGFIDDEISKRDKLIEQMREAFERINSAAWLIKLAQGNAACSCESLNAADIIAWSSEHRKAALAAERGGKCLKRS